EVRRRKTVPKRSRDRDTEACRRRGDPQIARRGNREPAAAARPARRGDGGHPHVLDRAEPGVHAALVFERLRGFFEIDELRDIRPRDERVAAPLITTAFTVASALASRQMAATRSYI